MHSTLDSEKSSTRDVAYTQTDSIQTERHDRTPAGGSSDLSAAVTDGLRGTTSLENVIEILSTASSSVSGETHTASNESHDLTTHGAPGATSEDEYTYTTVGTSHTDSQTTDTVLTYSLGETLHVEQMELDPSAGAGELINEPDASVLLDWVSGDVVRATGFTRTFSATGGDGSTPASTSTTTASTDVVHSVGGSRQTDSTSTATSSYADETTDSGSFWSVTAAGTIGSSDSSTVTASGTTDYQSTYDETVTLMVDPATSELVPRTSWESDYTLATTFDQEIESSGSQAVSIGGTGHHDYDRTTTLSIDDTQSALATSQEAADGAVTETDHRERDTTTTGSTVYGGTADYVLVGSYASTGINATTGSSAAYTVEESTVWDDGQVTSHELYDSRTYDWQETGEWYYLISTNGTSQSADWSVSGSGSRTREIGPSGVDRLTLAETQATSYEFSDDDTLGPSTSDADYSGSGGSSLDLVSEDGQLVTYNLDASETVTTDHHRAWPSYTFNGGGSITTTRSEDLNAAGQIDVTQTVHSVGAGTTTYLPTGQSQTDTFDSTGTTHGTASAPAAGATLAGFGNVTRLAFERDFPAIYNQMQNSGGPQLQFGTMSSGDATGGHLGPNGGADNGMDAFNDTAAAHNRTEAEGADVHHSPPDPAEPAECDCNCGDDDQGTYFLDQTSDMVGQVSGDTVTRNSATRSLQDVQQFDEDNPNATPEDWDAFFEEGGRHAVCPISKQQSPMASPSATKTQGPL